MRGLYDEKIQILERSRITPAHAGTMEEILTHLSLIKDHPRACGDYVDAIREKIRGVGSPPRMRGLLTFQKYLHFGLSLIHI